MPDDLHWKELYASFEVKLDPTTLDSLTITRNIRKLNSNDINQVLIYVCLFDNIVKKTGVPEGIQ
eukprot:11408464-Ditylum_brightwellii.AAC.1